MITTLVAGIVAALGMTLWARAAEDSPQQAAFGILALLGAIAMIMSAFFWLVGGLA